MPEKILNWVVGISATIIIIALVIFIIKDVISYLQGQGTSLMKILGKVGAVILIVACIFLAKSLKSKGEKASGTVGKAVDEVIDGVNKNVGGGGTNNNGGNQNGGKTAGNKA